MPAAGASRAPLGVTIGDAAGVGPELTLSAGRALAAQWPVVAYGSVELLRAALASLREHAAERGASAALFDAVAAVDDPDGAHAVPAGTLAVIDCPISHALPSLAPYPWGEPVAAFGALQHAALLRAIDDALAGRICGILTAPWHKARLADAGLPPTGHTEVLRDAVGAGEVVMMLAGEVLRVALATIHLPLREVPGALTTQGIVEVGRIVHAGLRDRYGISAPRVAFCGLNPHAGESGVLGDEDERVVAPAVRALRAEGIDAEGPYPADTLFPRVVAGLMRADAVVAMYHDQGLVPLKTVHFGESANITLGLPFVRTSVDHGTAYDIAGRGRVDPGSFLYAGRLALRLAGLG